MVNSVVGINYQINRWLIIDKYMQNKTKLQPYKRKIYWTLEKRTYKYAYEKVVFLFSRHDCGNVVFWQL